MVGTALAGMIALAGTAVVGARLCGITLGDRRFRGIDGGVADGGYTLYGGVYWKDRKKERCMVQ